MELVCYHVSSVLPICYCLPLPTAALPHCEWKPLGATVFQTQALCEQLA